MGDDCSIEEDSKPAAAATMTTAIPATVDSLDRMREVLQSSDSMRQVFQSSDSQALIGSILKSQDPFKSGDSFFNKILQTQPATPRSTSDLAAIQSLNEIFNSRDWKTNYADKHEEIDLTKVFQSSAVTEPARRGSATDWMALYQSELNSARPDATASNSATMAAPVPLATLSTAAASISDVPPSDVPDSTAIPTQIPSMVRSLPMMTSSKRRRKSTESNRDYVEPTNEDVLMGRGGRSNNHPGNKKYLHAKDSMQERYMKASKEEKTGISQELVDLVHGWGGRFLKLEDGGHWYVVDNKTARKKASQTLRELNTPEERAAKRAKYGH